MAWLREKWQHFMDWYGNYLIENEPSTWLERFPSKYKSLVFLPFVIAAFFVFFFVIYTLYG